ncbi:hypothetical protein HDU79_007644 [Rhizoclosmatium sp. JEL0117]|nr:hypothetical protein HDU79_007644 [Rhizoclosmatium sp. JEL0117]
MDPDTCRALGIGFENGISYDYIDRIDPDAFLSSTSRATPEITTNSVSGRSRPNSGGRKSRVSSPLKLDQSKSQIKQSSAEYFDLGVKSSEVMPIDLISPPPKGEGISIPVVHTIDDDDEQEELPLITETHFAPSTVNYLEWHDKNPDQKQRVQTPLQSSSLVTQEKASVNKLPPLKLYSKGYAISEPSSTLQKPPKLAPRKTKVVRVTTDEVILSQQHLEDIQEGLSTITIRNWQLKQEPSDFFGSAEEFRSQHSSIPDRNRVSERPSVYRDDDLAGLPTLGSIGLVIKPIRPISGTVRRTKKDAVWGQGGKRRHF